MMEVLHGASDLTIAEADIVEVAPVYDSAGGDTVFVVRVGYFHLAANVNGRKGCQLGM
jgi:agmatinase